MIINSIKTEIITSKSIGMDEFLDKYVPVMEEDSILIISSKVVSLIEGRTVSPSTNKLQLIKTESDLISKEPNRYDHHIVIKHNAFISGAGLDQSNGGGTFVLLPEHPYEIAEYIHTYIASKFNLSNFGVIITDSRSQPLRRGALGVAISFWGFAPLNNYVGKKDIFGRVFNFEQLNVVDSLAIAANVVMGEGSEQTPLAVIKEVDSVEFNKLSPTKRELKEFLLTLEEDFFHPFYKDVF